LKVIAGPVEWSGMLQCRACPAILEIHTDDVRIGFFGANYGGDSPEQKFFVECIVCGTENIVRVPPKVVAAALARQAAK